MIDAQDKVCIDSILFDCDYLEMEPNRTAVSVLICGKVFKFKTSTRTDWFVSIRFNFSHGYGVIANDFSVDPNRIVPNPFLNLRNRNLFFSRKHVHFSVRLSDSWQGKIIIIHSISDIKHENINISIDK